MEFDQRRTIIFKDLCLVRTTFLDSDSPTELYFENFDEASKFYLDRVNTQLGNGEIKSVRIYAYELKDYIKEDCLNDVILGDWDNYIRLEKNEEERIDEIIYDERGYRDSGYIGIDKFPDLDTLKKVIKAINSLSYRQFDKLLAIFEGTANLNGEIDVCDLKSKNSIKNILDDYDYYDDTFDNVEEELIEKYGEEEWYDDIKGRCYASDHGVIIYRG